MATRLDETVNVIADLGNTGLKDMLVGHVGTEDVIPHALYTPNEASYQAKKRRALYSPAAMRSSVIFEKVWKTDGGDVHQAYIVGDEALQSGQAKKITGADKYQSGYFDVLVAAKLLRRFPQGHNNIRMAVAHPPDAIPFVDKLMDLVGGVHRVITLDGRAVKFVVREVIPWDEPAGGLMRFMTIPGQEYNPHDIRAGMRLLVIDIGGKISSMTTVTIGENKSIEPLYGAKTSPVFPMGIQDAAGLLREELRSLYPDEFQPIRDIPQDMLEMALQEHRVMIANQPFDCQQAVLNAIYPLLDTIDGIYRNDMAAGRIFNHIIVTGGGGGLLFRYLYQDILKHQFVHLADLPERIHLANLRGGSESFKVWLARQERK